jgi:short-subunit dehydrogenase
MSLHLASLGFAVVGLVKETSDTGELERRAIENRLEVETRVIDLGDPAARATALDDLEPWGLINNAGYLNAGQLQEIDIDEARAQLEVMVLAPLDLVRRALPAMLRNSAGRIVNVTSAASHSATPLSGWYQASKAALRELTDALRIELRETGVDVVDVEPGGFTTGIWPRAESELRRRRAKSVTPAPYDAVLKQLAKLEPKMGDPARVGEAVGSLMTMGSPPPHRRVGHDSTAMRLIGDFLPDRLTDPLIGRIERRAAH